MAVATSRAANRESAEDDDRPIGHLQLDATFQPGASGGLFGRGGARGAAHQPRSPGDRDRDGRHDRPEDAIRRSATILQDQLSAFVKLDETRRPLAVRACRGRRSIRSCCVRWTTWN